MLFGERGYAGASFQQYDSEYGTVAEADVTIRLRQQRWDLAGELRPERAFLRAVTYKLGHSDYRHEEREGGATGTVFKNRGHDGRVEFLHRRLGPMEGAFGLQTSVFDFQALGAEAFLPRTETESNALFVYEELPLGRPRAGAEDGVKLSFGGRVERTSVRADPFLVAGKAADERRFTARSASVGVFAPLTGTLGLASGIAYTQRAPTYQELYADGPHLATGAFEIGNRHLGRERSAAINLALRRRGNGWRGSVGVFYNRFEDYIALAPATNGAGAALFRDAEDRTLPATADAGAANYAQPIRQYLYAAIPASLKGFEAEGAWPLWQRGARRIEVELRADHTRATNREDDAPLPRMPALRYGGALIYKAERVLARLEVLHVRKQDRVPQGESPVDGYTLLGAALNYRLRRQGIDWEGFIKADNLLNEEARSATSFLRDRAPMAARGVSVGLRGAF